MKLFLDCVRGASRWLPLDARAMGDLDGLQRWHQKVSVVLDRCVPFEVSNVADYFYAGTDQEVWDLFSDFPRTVPPFEWTWLEWSIPTQVRSLGHMGTLNLSKYARRAGILVTWDRAVEAERKEHPACEFKVNVIPFMESALSDPFVLATCCFGLNSDYDPVSVRAGAQSLLYAFNGLAAAGQKDENALRDLGTQACILMYPGILALSMLNCRNVKTLTHEACPALRRKHAKRGHPIPTPYRTIEIQPFITQISKTTGECGYSRRAAAIVRGHFKDYRHGKGLFGRTPGLFWWDQQLHGSHLGADYAMKRSAGPLDQDWVRQQSEQVAK